MNAPVNFNAHAEAHLIEEARRLRPFLRQHVGIHEQNGRLSDEVVKALCDAGFHNMASPRRWNGLGMSSAAMARVAAELAQGCPSTAWVFSITNSLSFLLSQFPDSIQKEAFKNGSPLLTSPQNGTGTLTETEGGYLLNGKWAYATNCHHAQYAMLTAMSAEGFPHLSLVDVGAVKILNTWKVAGMRGTGSDTLVAENAFVPRHLCCRMQGVGGAEPYTFEKEPSDYWIAFPLLRSKAVGVLVGCVEGQLEAVVEVSNRPPVYSTFAQKRDSATFRSMIGEVKAKIRAARIIMDATDDVNDHAAVARRRLSAEERLDCRVETTQAIRLLNEASSLLMDLAGSSGFSETNLAQQFWRDFNVGSRHIVFNPYVSYEAYGATVLGMTQEVLTDDFL